MTLGDARNDQRSGGGDRRRGVRTARGNCLGLASTFTVGGPAVEFDSDR